MEKTSTAPAATQSATLKGANRPGVHLILQGKGGVGKSLVASILGQYFLNRSEDVSCIDTDPVNHTLAQYQALRAEHLKLMVESRIDVRLFDQLMERLLTQDQSFVIDNGASTFIPLWDYILENEVVETLQDAGRSVFLHSVVTGGQAMLDTLSGFHDLAANCPARNLVVWVNEFFGPVESDGKRFRDMKVFAEHRDRIRGTVTIPKRSADTFGRDIEEMLRAKRTFAEVLEDRQFSIMSRQRLALVRRDLFEQLDRLAFGECL
jgi:hypothetical protein